jgi:hypothetical protein
MQLVVAVTNQKALYTSRLRANKDIFSVYNSRYIFALIVFSDWSIFFKSSPLKLLPQMNRNLLQSIYEMSFIKIPHIVPFR